MLFTLESRENRVLGHALVGMWYKWCGIIISLLLMNSLNVTKDSTFSTQTILQEGCHFSCIN